LWLPAAACFYGAVAVYAAYRHLSGRGTPWKGRALGAQQEPPRPPAQT